MTSTRRIVAIAVAAYLLLVLADRFVLVQLLAQRDGLQFLLAAWEALAIIGAGFGARALFRRSAGVPPAGKQVSSPAGRRDAASPAAEDGRVPWQELDFAREFLLGYPIFGALCFLLGLINISTWTMGALLLVAGAGGLFAVVRRIEIGAPDDPLPAGEGGAQRRVRLDALPLVAIAVAGLLAFIAAQAPPISLDELAYHLAVPWAWVKEHRAIDLPLISHSYFPLGIESADLPLLTILGRDGAIASHFLHLGAAIASTVMLWRLARGNALAVAAVATTPALAMTAGWSLVDWPLVGICAALVHSVDEDDTASLSTAIAAGLLTKYTFIPFAIIVLVLAKRWRGVLAGAALGSIFLLRNLFLAHNPIAPFLGALAPHVAGYRGAPLLNDYVFDGHFIDEGLGASMLAACALSTGLLSWLLVIAGVLLFLLAPSARILLPFFAIPAARSLPTSRTIRALLTAAIIVQLFLIAFFVDRNQSFSLLSGNTTDEDFLLKQRPATATVTTIDALTPPNALVLVVGLSETFWFEHRVRGGGNFDGPRLSAYLDAPTPEALYARLKGDGITHVAIVAPGTPQTEVARKIEERQTALAPAAQRALSQMLDRYAGNVVSRERATLFTLR
jgi:hypothetical protein